LRLGYTVPVFLALLLLPSAASAQNKTESVTVTGQSAQTRTEIMRGFIRSTVTPSYGTGKLARWTDPVCPLVIGLTPQENAAVKERIRKDVQVAGATQSREPCAPNVTVAFALEPQKLITQIATSAKLKGHIGDNDGGMHRAKLSKVVAPIQAWYGTMLTGKHGVPGVNELPYPGLQDYYGAPYFIGEASLLNDGHQSNIKNVFVVVDLDKVDGRQVGTIADYVAMLTLSETEKFATCRQMPSITNLLVADCDARLKTSALSDADLAFLRGVYKTKEGDNMNLAIGDILREMQMGAAGPDVKEPVPEQSSSTAPTPKKQ
jgi:hypothetical protein